MKPRDRIASHLQRILVAAGMALPVAGHGDTTTPKPPGDDGNKPKQGSGNKKKEPEHLGYEVVDMMPAPFIDRDQKGTLDLKTTPSGLSISIDGKAVPKKTPLKGYKLPIGVHAITISDGKRFQNFTVEIKADQTTVEKHLLEPSPAPKTEKGK